MCSVWNWKLWAVYMNPDWVTIEIDTKKSVSVDTVCRGWNYTGICLHESRLSYNSFRTEFIPFFILDGHTINKIEGHYGQYKDCLQNGKFRSRTWISAKIVEKVRWSVHISETSLKSILNSISHACKHELNLKCRLGLKSNPDSCKLPLRQCCRRGGGQREPHSIMWRGAEAPFLLLIHIQRLSSCHCSSGVLHRREKLILF